MSLISVLINCLLNLKIMFSNVVTSHSRPCAIKIGRPRWSSLVALKPAASVCGRLFPDTNNPCPQLFLRVNLPQVNQSSFEKLKFVWKEYCCQHFVESVAPLATFFIPRTWSKINNNKKINYVEQFLKMQWRQILNDAVVVTYFSMVCRSCGLQLSWSAAKCLYFGGLAIR